MTGNTRAEIKKYEVTQNVSGYGNCGIYTSMEGLVNAGTRCPLDVNTFRKDTYGYILSNTTSVLPTLKFSGKMKNSRATRGITRERYIREKVMDRIWNKYLDFGKGCIMDYWVASSLHFPILVEMFMASFIWFDVNDSKTYGVIKV